LPEWRGNGDSRRDITLDQLLRMTSGLSFNEDYEDHSSDVIQMLFVKGDKAGFAASKPLQYSPGSHWSYSGGTSNIIARILRQRFAETRCVLGNHDTICMVPGLEAMGIRMLLNESDVIVRGGQRLHLGGIDDAHFYGMDNVEKAAAAIPHDEFSILISHTPEVYRQAARADFNLLLSGHYPWRPDLPSGRLPNHA
jgi:Beta-lactamase